MDPFNVSSDQCRLEQGFWAAEALVPQRDVPAHTVGRVQRQRESVGGFEEGTIFEELFFVVEGEVTEVLFDLPYFFQFAGSEEREGEIRAMNGKIMIR